MSYIEHHIFFRIIQNAANFPKVPGPIPKKGCESPGIILEEYNFNFRYAIKI